MGAPKLVDERVPAAELGQAWVSLEEHAEAGQFAQVRVAAAEISKALEGREDPEALALRERLKETLEYGRNRAFEIGMAAVGRSFVGLYEAASKLQGEGHSLQKQKKPSRRRRKIQD